MPPGYANCYTAVKTSLSPQALRPPITALMEQRGSAIARLRAALRGDGGYSLAEVTVATTIMASLAAIASVSIGTALTLSAQFDSRAVNSVATAAALEGITSNIALASPIESVASNQIVLQVARNGNCERHTYYTMADTNAVPRSLSHKVQEIPLAVGATCANLEPSVWTRTGATEIGRVRVDRMEVDKLGVNPNGTPVFSYYSLGGARLRVPGDAGYVASRDLAAACLVGRVSVALPMQQPDGTVRVIQTDITPRSAAVSQTC